MVHPAWMRSGLPIHGFSRISSLTVVLFRVAMPPIVSPSWMVYGFVPPVPPVPGVPVPPGTTSWSPTRMRSLVRMAGFRSRSVWTVVPYRWEIPHSVSPGCTTWTDVEEDWADAVTARAVVGAGAGVNESNELAARAAGAAFGARAGDLAGLVDGNDAEGRTGSELRRMALKLLGKPTRIDTRIGERNRRILGPTRKSVPLPIKLSFRFRSSHCKRRTAMDLSPSEKPGSV